MILALWQRPATPLPFSVRPVRGETTSSYLFRLARTNELVVPTTLLRALGEPSVSLDRYMLRDHEEIMLNRTAQQRLACFAGMPLERLRSSLPLPALADTREKPSPRTAIQIIGSHIRDHCASCCARIPGNPPIQIYFAHSSIICRRHRRWLGTRFERVQIDLSGSLEILTAYRRRDRLFRAEENQHWVDTQFAAAQAVTTAWSRITDSFYHTPLLRRWEARSAVLASATKVPVPPSLVMMPETVIIAEAICDPVWRHQIATAEHYFQQKNFYAHMVEQLGLRRTTAYAFSAYNDPLRDWVERHRLQHRSTYSTTKTHSVTKSRRARQRTAGREFK
ncbi:TniQ family protein [Nocardia niigatensis]|uniref:TniQ family protein n=1 Tax=Nocardia niigatensis TaxID=209249 RepID=UPI000318A033|nr:TniQ family protein [Nocardia niigatensis]